MAFDLELEFILSGKPKRVMQLLTDPVLIRKWSGGEAVFEKMVGGRFEMFDGWVTGKVTKVSENELAYTWTAGDWEDGTPASEVHYLLKPDEAGTKVIVHHTGFPNEKERDSHKTGWTDFFFDPMEDFILIIDKS
ncbi:MAG: glutathione S-transferase [Flavipsychrobacter sp.]|nr:glutathione S-transferase [Flavipsychrobacter sp.]